MLPLHDVHRILALDDDEIMRDLLHALLSAEGLELTLACSGEEALAILRVERFDAVLSDLHMPGLEGEALAESLRSAVPDTTLLLGMSSSEPSPELRFSFDAFLLKPFDVQLLRDAIVLARRLNVARNGIQTRQEELPVVAAKTEEKSLDNEIYGSLAKMISASQLSELFAMALKDIGKRHTRMVEAASTDDLAAVQREAHAMKGSCGMLGATELQTLAATIEEAPSVHTSAIEEIPQACIRLQRMLDSKFHTA